MTYNFFVLVLTEVNSFVLLLKFFNRYSPNLFKMRWFSFVINHKNFPFYIKITEINIKSIYFLKE